MMAELPSQAASQQISTRRKSCIACVKAKRRCDLQKPCCNRCGTRGLLCNYPRINPGVTQNGIENSQTFDLASTNIGIPTACIGDSQTFDLPFEYQPYTNITFPDAERENPQLFDIPFEFPAYTNSSIPAPVYRFDDLLSPTLIPPKTLYPGKDRIDLCIQQLKNCVPNIVERGRTPFMNSNVYGDSLPSSLQDVFCVCAAYISKTTTNEALVFNILSSKLDELISKRRYFSFEDELASVQALIIFQIIRLFDGDIRQRGRAETQFQVLDSWATQLRQRCEFDIPLMSSPYRKWLFIESMRRTVLMSIFLKGIYYAIKDGFCSEVPEMAGLPLTVRGELWEAKSEAEWMQATHGQQLAVLPYHEFVYAWDGGSTEGVEDLQKMLLVACIGEEGIQTRFLESLTRGVEWR